VVTVNAVLLAALRAVAGPDEDTLFDRLPTRLTAMTSSRTTMKLFDRLYLATPGADLLDGVRIDLDREPLIVAVDES
jgi:hypothetical protein